MATAIEAPAHAAGALISHTPFQARRAVKDARPARVAINGTPGSGRTLTALRIAAALGERVAVLDTNRGAASQYADQVDFDVIELVEFTPDALRLALWSAGWAGYDALVVDDSSAFWSGRSGLLEQVDAAQEKAGKNALPGAGWSAVRPAERAMTDALLAYPGHLVLTLRSRTETTLLDDGRGRLIPVQGVGKTEQRDGLEYDMDVVGTLLPDHTLVVTKSRVPLLDGAVVEQPGAELGKTVREWAETGGPGRAPVVEFYRAAYAADATVESLEELEQQLGWARAEHMPAVNPADEPTPLIDVVRVRVQGLKARARREQQDAERRARQEQRGGGQARRDMRQAPPADRTAAVPVQAPHPQPAPPVEAPARVPGCDGPVARPRALDVPDDSEGPLRALALIVDRLRAEETWTSLPKVVQVKIHAAEADVLEAALWCEDDRHRELRHLLDDRIHELKQGTLLAGAA